MEAGEVRTLERGNRLGGWRNRTLERGIRLGGWRS